MMPVSPIVGTRIRRLVSPPLSGATYSDPNAFGSWSELGGGRLRFSATGFAVAATADAPAAGATLMWPATRPDGAALDYGDIVGGINSRIVQIAGTPGVATNYAVVSGVCNAAMTEYAFGGVDHAVSVGRGAVRWASVAYTTGAATRNGQWTKIPLAKTPGAGGAIILGYLDAAGLASLTTIDLGTSGTNTTGALRVPFAANPADLRYFVSFFKRGALASRPTDIDIEFGFDVWSLQP